jgi:Family of unknown function (DUF5908)
MPVQINEVIIRAVVDGNNTSAGLNAAPVNQVNTGTASGPEIAALVLQIIKEKNER